jgi:hypothetical protein
MADDSDSTSRITQLIESLRSDDEFDRQFAERGLIAIGIPAVQPLLQVIDDEDIRSAISRGQRPWRHRRSVSGRGAISAIDR